MSAVSNNDTPTHRLHIMQMRLDQIKEDLEGIRHRRSLVQEKVAKAKANSKVSREAQVNKQLAKFFTTMERKLTALDEDIDALEDTMNKARALILEASDGELMLPKTE
jgi:predicted  nucleic acid-binding Zn-ribbon protein